MRFFRKLAVDRNTHLALLLALTLGVLPVLRAAGRVDLEKPLYKEILTAEERSRTVTTQRYEATDLPLTPQESFESDWILYNPQDIKEIGLRERPGGRTVYQFGRKGLSMYASLRLRFPWNQGEPGTVHVVSVEMASGYEHGNPAHEFGGFQVQGPGTSAGVDVSQFLKVEDRIHVHLLSREGNEHQRLTVTDRVEEALGGPFQPEDLHV